MLALMTYLGHALPSSTYWYLECSPRLMEDIAEVCERLFEAHSS
jgi:integrase/recombinase XerD